MGSQSIWQPPKMKKATYLISIEETKPMDWQDQMIIIYW